MIKIMIAVVILACMGPFFINGPDGKPLMTLDDLKPDMSSLWAPTAQRGEQTAVESAKKTLYKWQDADGGWHFSDRAEDAGNAGAAVIEADSRINIMPAITAPANDTAIAEDQPPATPPGNVSLGQGIDTLKAAMELQQTIDSRKAEMDKELKKAGG